MVASGVYLDPTASSLWDLSGTRRPLENGKQRRRIRGVARRSGTGRRELSRQREGVEKQQTRWRRSEHVYRNKEREERAEEDRPPAVCAPPFLAGRGRGER